MLRLLGDRIAFHAQKAQISRMFKRHIGYAGDFENPQTYQEKIQFRKLYGNHAFYALAADKYRVREYVAAKAGEQYLIPLLGAYDRLDASVFDDLPKQFIIKANHGCKWHRIVRDREQLDVARTVRYFNKLCRRRYGWAAGERHYNFIRPKIVIEQLLEAEDGGLPWDYNFFCYNGPKGFDYALAVATPDGKGAHFDNQGELLESRIPAALLQSHVENANFPKLLEVAKALSADFDFVRVDLYCIADRVYFGELTCTPHQGFGPIANEKRQRMRTEMWHLDVNNPLLYRKPAAAAGWFGNPLSAVQQLGRAERIEIPLSSRKRR